MHYLNVKIDLNNLNENSSKRIIVIMNCLNKYKRYELHINIMINLQLPRIKTKNIWNNL